MSIKGYIERKKALQVIDWYIMLKNKNYGNPTVTLDELVGLLIDVPVADVVEVVRCKDCQRFMPYTADDLADGNDVEGADGVCYLRIVNSEDKQFCAIKNTDFCSYGERKKPNE